MMSQGKFAGSSRMKPAPWAIETAKFSQSGGFSIAQSPIARSSIRARSPLPADIARNGAPESHHEEERYLNDFTAAASSSFTSNTV